MSTNCGHCGSEVKDGFKVCSGCGAHYRFGMKMVLGGIFVLIIGLATMPEYLSAGLILIGIGALGIYMGGRRKWYRHNA